MKIGVSIPQRGRLADAAALRAAARAAEQVGYASLWVADARPRALDPVATLAFVAGVTDRIALGARVQLGPEVGSFARAVGTLDVLGQRRLVLGLDGGDDAPAGGAGYDARRAIDEALDALEPADLDLGDRGRADRSRPPRRVPVLLGGSDAATLQHVARRADGWSPASGDLSELRRGWATVLDLAHAAGRDPASLRLVVRAGVDRSPDTGRTRRSFQGSLDEIVEDLLAARALGADEVVLAFRPELTLDEMLDGCARLAEGLDGPLR